MQTILTGFGVFIVLVLAATAAYLHWRLHRVQQAQQAREEAQIKQAQQAREEWNSSLRILCRALLAEQVGYAEACIRISGILDRLAVPADARQEYVAIDKLAAAVAHIPILEAWQQLSKQQKLGFEVEIAQQEEQLGDFVRAAAEKMLHRSF